MRMGRPRTLLGMVLMGLAFVTVPLLVAVGNAMIKLGQLAAESEVVLADSATATLENQRLANLLDRMERNARQYLTLQTRRVRLGPPAVVRQRPSGPREEHRGIADVAERDAGARPARAADCRYRRTCTGCCTVRAPEEAIVHRFGILMDATRAVADGMRATTNVRLERLQENTRSAQQELAWLSAALIPGTLVLVGLFLLLVGRPLRQIDRAIRELGEGDFSRPITVSGPHDIELLGRQLESLRHRLKESTDEKNKFLRHMSHELKTPLANIREGTELLLDGSVGQLDIQQHEVTNILRDNGVKLQTLIENLLTFSAWQTHTAALDLSEFELKPMVFSVLSQHRLALIQQEGQAAACDQSDQRARRRRQAEARVGESRFERAEVHAKRRHDSRRCRHERPRARDRRQR